MFYSDDPVRDSLRHDREMKRKLDRRPKCSVCGEPIQDDLYMEKDDEPICAECCEEEHGISIRHNFYNRR
jgi:formylmethanofuran dehydrogenase subunit E